MLKTVKESVHRMTSHLQLINGYLEMEDYAKALGKTGDAIKELHALASNGAGERAGDSAAGWGGRGFRMAPR
jgi:hypothetical protein